MGVQDAGCEEAKKEKRGEVNISISEFERALGKVDSQMKALPATAQVSFQPLFIVNFFFSSETQVLVFQVAAQQGDYLAKCFNKLQDENAPPEGPLRVRSTGRHRFKPFV